MDIVVAYDVNTEDKAGERRLRRVAKVCEAYGQRVQWSVFECSLNEMQYDALLRKLGALIEPRTDSLRIYRLHGRRAEAVTVMGRDRFTDFSKPLVY